MSTKKTKGYAPAFGGDVEDEYVESYRRTHEAPPTYNYRLGYFPLLLADSLLRDYRMLDIGCGTGGYLRLLRNASSVVGLDYSRKMLAAAKDLLGDDSFDELELVCSDFESYHCDRKFHLIRVGVYGTYVPFSSAMLMKVHSLLEPDGLTLLAVDHPQGIKERLKGFFAENRRRINASTFTSMLKNCGFDIDLHTVRANRDYFLARKVK